MLPFQASTKGLTEDGLPPPSPFKVMPTAQHCCAFAQVEPSRTSLEPVPGTVATYQPDGAAVAACGTAMTAPPSSAATMSNDDHVAAGRRRVRRPRGARKAFSIP